MVDCSKIDEKVEEFFAASLDYDVNSITSITLLLDAVKEQCALMSGENSYYKEDISKRFFAVYNDAGILNLRLELLSFKLARFISRVKICILQDKKADFEKEEFNLEVTNIQETLSSDLIKVHNALLQLTKDIRKHGLESYGALKNVKEPS